MNARTIQRGRKLVWHAIKREKQPDLKWATLDKPITKDPYQREALRTNQMCKWSLRKTTKQRLREVKKGGHVPKSEVEPESPRAREIPDYNVNPEDRHTDLTFEGKNIPGVTPFLQRFEGEIKDTDIQFVPPPKRRAPKFEIT